MHHHHALALLLFSIVFAAFALFTLCTFAPKAHSANIVNNPGKEDISVSALAGLPIRRRSNDVDSYEHLFARDDILITSKGHGTATMSDQGDLDTSRNFPVIQLIQLDTDEKVKHKDTYNPCRQEIRFSDPSLRFEDATTDQSSKSVWDDLLTAVTFLKRDSLHNLSDACLEYLHQEGKPSNIALVEDDSADQDEDDEDDDCSDDEENQRAGTYLMQRRVKRSVSPTGEDLYRNGRLGGVVSTKTTGPRFNSKVNGIPMKHQPSNPQADGGMLQRRDVDNSDILGLSEPLQKKRVMIDFKKAERDAHLANLADGFIIETEYLTPGRKVVQHVNKKPDTRTVKLHFEGDQLVLDDPLNSNQTPPPAKDALGIMDNVLSTHDQYQMEPFINPYPQFGSHTTQQQQPATSHPRYDLAKRSPSGISKSPSRRSFRFDRIV